MVAIKGMKPQTDCQKCPLMATDGADTLLSPMMCVALWATKHEVKHCVEGKILDDCPLVEADESRWKTDKSGLEYADQDTMMSAT